MADNILVGDEGCTFNDIGNFILTHPLRDTVLPGLTSVALTLGTAKHSVDNADKKIFLGIDKPLPVFIGFLGEWRQLKHKDATLKALCKAFKDNQIVEFANALETNFGVEVIWTLMQMLIMDYELLRYETIGIFYGHFGWIRTDGGKVLRKSFIKTHF